MIMVSEANLYLQEDEYRVGTRLWGEVDGHVEIVYEEYENGNFVEKSRVLLSEEQLDAIYKASKFMIDMERMK